MNDEAKRLVNALRNSYGYSEKRDNDAADMIEKLSADLESDDRQYSRIAFDTIVAEGLKTESDRDAWKRRAEAAERDVITMLRSHVDDIHCDQCAKEEHREMCRYYGKDMCPDAEWRGPCAENGGDTNP